MRLDDLIVEVRDKSFARVGLVSLTEAHLTFTDTESGVGEWELILPLEHPMTPELRKPGYGIVATGFGSEPYSGPVDQSSSKGSAADPEGMVTFRGYTDDVVLADHLALPVPENPTVAGQAARANHVEQGKTETVMHAFVNKNIGPGAPAARRAPGLSMGTNLGRGPDIHKSARFPQLLELLREMSALSGIGFRVVQRGNGRTFETYEPADRRKTIRMDLRNSTLSSYESISAGPLVTHAWVAGKDEGTERQLALRSTAESERLAAAWGRRRERFLDRRSSDEQAELDQAGDEVLAKEGIDQSVVKFVPMDEETMVYGVDWNLGDIVTAVVEGREVAARVTAAILKVDDKGVRVACALGDLDAADPDAQTRKFRTATETRLSALERTAESGAEAPPLTSADLPETIYGGFPGEVRMFAGASNRAPSGWLLCDGRALSRTTYAALFAAIGTSFGVGNGTSTFNIPDMRGRVAAGVDTTQTEFNSIGKQGGAKTHTLTTAEMPSHTHTQAPHTHTLRVNGNTQTTLAYVAAGMGAYGVQPNMDGSVLDGSSATPTINSTGGGGAHNNLQPYTAINYVIKT